MRMWKLLSRLALVGTLVSLSSVVHAGKFGVRVLDANTGLPVANAAVCLGTAADRNLYGTGITTHSGVALYDNVPEKAVLITVSKSNYRGIALHSPATRDNVIADVLVTEGLSSKKCRALKYVDLKPGITQGKYEADWPLQITALSYFPSGNDGFAFLSYSQGKPTHYRVSTDPEFKGAEWLPYTDVFQYSPNQSDLGKETLYFQLRKEIKAGGGVVEALSVVTSHPVKI